MKRPNNHIVGGGFFSHFTTLPLSQAWDFFGEENGASSFRQFAELIAFNAHATASAERQIGCTVVSDVFYLPREAWIPVEGLFPKPIMVGKQYDSSEELGATLWQRIQSALPLAVSAQVVGEEDAPRYGAEFLQRGRLGQGAFRTLVLDAYARRCALTGESTLPVLEAAHIRPYADQGRHLISNGLLLRSDFHKLFDLGLVTVQPDYRIRISSRIRDQYFNGKAYYRLDGQELALLPERLVDRPDREALRWHNENRFMS
ncbi:MAG: HNH endonuclease [Pseudomonadota bacterium]|nr:HNH endonuclease [Pseudomonadota bacterium]